MVTDAYKRNGITEARKSRDEEIDFSDIPELSDDQIKKIKKVGRPVKGVSKRKRVSVSFDPFWAKPFEAIAEIEGENKNNLINLFVERYVKNKMDKLSKGQIKLFKLTAFKNKKAA